MSRPRLSYYISGKPGEVSTDSDLWKLPLLNRTHFPPKNKKSSNSSPGMAVTVGDYLSAAGEFLGTGRYSPLKAGLKDLSGQDVRLDEIRRIDLFLEKHGAFYHPIHVKVRLENDDVWRLVVNGAVSEQGVALIQHEFELIRALGRHGTGSFLPRVYANDVLSTGSGPMGFFAGEWFEGYEEFHLTHDNGRQEIAIWSSTGACRYIAEELGFGIYQEISRILTTYYNLESFEQIFPWHHAAGDFIVKQTGDDFRVKLITARGYDNQTDFDPEQPDGNTYILPALLMFVLNLTIKVRLDRLNGTGEPVMVDERVIPFVIKGVLQGLKEKSLTGDHGNSADALVLFYNQFSTDQLIEIMENILCNSPPAPSERELLQKNIHPHFRNVSGVFKAL